MTQNKNPRSLNSIIGQRADQITDLPFSDPLFPPNGTSVGFPSTKIEESDSRGAYKPFAKRFGRASKIVTKEEDIYWERLPTILNEYYLCRIIKNEEELIDDVVQGNLGDCYFVSALSALAEKAERVNHLFPILSTKNIKLKKEMEGLLLKGLISTTVYINGKKTEIILDDYFPVNYLNENSKTPVLAFSGIENFSLNVWPLFLEKAWAKCNSSYFNIVDGNITQAFEFLTPAPTELFFHELSISQDDLFMLIKRADELDYMICADISERPNHKRLDKLKSLGLLTNHAYSVISIHQMNSGEKLLKLRNPWGSLEWNGAWSDKSNKWTPEAKKELNLGDDAIDDGIFYMEFSDYFKFFTCTHICKHHSDYDIERTNIELTGNKLFELSFIKATHCFVIVNQSNTKIMKNLLGKLNFKNELCSVAIYKKLERDNGVSGTLAYVASTASRQDRVHIELQAEPGAYVVMISFPHLSVGNLSQGIFTTFENLNNCEAEIDYRFGVYCSSECNVLIKELFSDFCDDKQSVRSSSSSNKITKQMIEVGVFDLANRGIKDYFLNDNELTTWRASYAESEDDSFGVIAYFNDSNAFIKETIILRENVNIKIVNFNSTPIQQIVNDKNILFFETNKHREVYETLKVTEPESKDSILESKSGGKVVLTVVVPPKHQKALMLVKTEEFAEVSYDTSSQLIYPLSFLIAGLKFPSQKQRMVFQNNLEVEIVQSITKLSAGYLIAYYNKTNEFQMTAQLNFSGIQNFLVNEELISIQNKQKPEIKLKSRELESSILFTIEPSNYIVIELKSKDSLSELQFKFKSKYTVEYTEDFISNSLNKGK